MSRGLSIHHMERTDNNTQDGDKKLLDNCNIRLSLLFGTTMPVSEQAVGCLPHPELGAAAMKRNLERMKTYNARLELLLNKRKQLEHVDGGTDVLDEDNADKSGEEDKENTTQGKTRQVSKKTTTPIPRCLRTKCKANQKDNAGKENKLPTKIRRNHRRQLQGNLLKPLVEDVRDTDFDKTDAIKIDATTKFLGEIKCTFCGITFMNATCFLVHKNKCGHLKIQKPKCWTGKDNDHKRFRYDPDFYPGSSSPRPSRMR